MNLKAIALLASTLITGAAIAGENAERKCAAGSCSKKTSSAAPAGATTVADAGADKKDGSCSKKEKSCSKKEQSKKDASCSKK